MRSTKERPHGYAKYRLENCRCEVCRKACRDYNRLQVVRAANGIPNFVDAAPVRAHVQALRAAGLGWRRIAALAGVQETLVNKLLRGTPSRGTGPSKRIRPENAAKLLAVTPSLEKMAGKARIDPTGTRRRLQALVAVGWSQSKLTERLGMQPTNFSTLVRGRSERVWADTARAVRDLYEQLWDTPPPEDTQRDRIAASRARSQAARHGWLPPMAWDDDLIDDPTPERVA